VLVGPQLEASLELGIRAFFFFRSGDLALLVFIPCFAHILFWNLTRLQKSKGNSKKVSVTSLVRVSMIAIRRNSTFLLTDHIYGCQFYSGIP